MKYCPNPDCSFLKEFNKVAEFQNDVMVCTDCGTMLEIGNAPMPEELRRMHPSQTSDERTSLVVLTTFEDPVEANLFQARLQAEGIPAMVASSGQLTKEWQFSLGGSTFRGDEVLVREEDLQRAKEILEQIDDVSPEELVQLFDQEYPEAD